MKKLLHTLLLFAVGLFAACQAPTSGGDVYLNDFLDDLTAQTDAGPAIRAALSHCARIRAARLILPGGELRIRPDLAVGGAAFDIEHLVPFGRVFLLFVQPNSSCVTIAGIYNIGLVPNIQYRFCPVLAVFRFGISGIKGLIVSFVKNTCTCQVPHFELPVFFVIPDPITEGCSVESAFGCLFPFLIRSEYRIPFVEPGSMNHSIQISFCNQKRINK